MTARQISTLHVEPIGAEFRVLATSYSRTMPSGLGHFATARDAQTAMNKLQAHLDLQRAKKEPTKKMVRAMRE